MAARRLGVSNEVLIEKLRAGGMSIKGATDLVSDREVSAILEKVRLNDTQAVPPAGKNAPSVRLPTPRAPLRSPQVGLSRPPLSNAPKPPSSMLPKVPMTSKPPLSPVSGFGSQRSLKNTPPLTAPKPPPLLFKPKPSVAPKLNPFASSGAGMFAPKPNVFVAKSNIPTTSRMSSATIKPSLSAPKPPPLPNFSKPKPLTAPPVPTDLFQRPKVEDVPSEPTKKKTLSVKPPLVLRELAMLLDVKPFRLISELMQQGIFASINQVMDETVAQKLAAKHGAELIFKRRTQDNVVQKPKEVPKIDESKLLEPRPPIVCILGHVDHGKQPF